MWTITFVCGIMFHEVIESFLLGLSCGDFILTELNHFFYSFFNFGLTSIVTLHAQNNSLMLSARALNTMDGLQDWELLSLLREKNPDAAKQIALGVAKDFKDLHTDPISLEAARAEVLKILSEA